MTEIAAARAALGTHDHLREVGARMPDHEQDPNAWLEWYGAEYRPSYEAWDRAMVALAASGYEGSRHPFNFRPYCIEMLNL